MRAEDARRWREAKRDDWGRFAGAFDYERRIGSYALRVDDSVVSGFFEDCRGRFLDLPCGAGRMSLALARSDRAIISADYSVDMLRQARRGVPGPFARCDAFRLPLADDSIDHALCLRLFFHYADWTPILGELSRVVRPGGRIVFDTLNVVSTRHVVEGLLKLAGRRRTAPGVRFHGRRFVERAAAAAGLTIARRESRYVVPTRAYRLLPKALHGLVRGAERLVPNGLRVLTFWKAVKAG